MRIHRAVVLACAAAVASAAAAQRPAPLTSAAPAPLAPGPAMILGRVVEAGTSTGVSGAVVTLGGPALGAPNAVFSNGTPGGPRRVATDGQGHFLFRDLPAGTYGLNATATGYVGGVYGQTRIIQIRRTLDLVRTLEITDTDRTVTASIAMWKNGGIAGRVVDEAGEPMVGVPVTVLARMTDWGGPVMQITSSVMTDDRGMYHADVVPGDYIVGVLAATATAPVSAVEGFVQARNEGGAAMDAYMNGIVARGGFLARGFGTRVGDLVVSQLGMRNAPVVPPIDVASGRAMFYPTTYHPSSHNATGATLVTLASGEEKSGIDLVLRPVPALRLSGQVFGPDGPAAGIALRLAPDDPAVRRTSPATLIDIPMAVADGNGEFTFLGVAPGSYTLFAQLRPQAPQPAWWAAEPVTVGDDNVLNLQVRLQPGASVSGRVVIDPAAAAAPPPQLRTIGIVARPVPGGVAAFMTSGTARPDASGRFTTPQAPPGPYQMTVAGIPPGWILKSVTTNGQNAVDRTFQLPPSGIDDMVVTITNQISIVTGVVRDSNGQPAGQATVASFPVDRGLWRLPGMASRRVQVAAPGRDGRYTFRGLPSGEYYVAAVEWPSADFSDGQVLSAIIPFASRVTLADGETKSQDLRVTVMR